MLRQNFKKKFITKDEAFLLLYVDDGASLFNSRNDAIVRASIILNQMKRMGLNTHVGSGKKSSKTKAVFFLRDQIFRNGYVKENLKVYFHQKRNLTL